MGSEDEDDTPRSSKGQNVDTRGRFILLGYLADLGWKPTEIKDDFGFDGTVAVFQNQKHTCLDFPFQLKSKGKLRLNKDKRIVCSDFTRRTINLFQKSNGTPVIFAVETSTRNIYWEFAALAVQRWLKSDSEKRRRSGKITLHIERQKLDQAGIKLLIDTLRKIESEALKPVQLIDGRSIQLAKLDANSDAADIRQELQDAVDNSNAGNYKRALERGIPLLTRATGQDATRVRKLLSKCYYELGQAEKAIAISEAGFKSGDPGLIGNLIALLSKSKQFAKAQSYSGRLSKQLLDNPIIINALGFMNLARGDSAPALEFYDRAIAKDKNLLEARINRAFILRDRGDLAAAKLGLKEIYEESPSTEEARVAYANILLMEDSSSHDKLFLDEASKIYSNVISRFSKNEPKNLIHKDAEIGALMGLAVVETRNANMDRAHALMTTAVQKGGTWTTVYFNLAQCEMALGRPIDARRNYVLSLRAPEDDDRRPVLAGRQKYWQGLAGACIAIYDLKDDRKHRDRFINKALWAYRIASTNETFPFGFLNYGVTLIKANRINQAAALAENNLKKRGGHYLRAMCFKARKNFQGMLDELEIERTQDPKDFQVNAEIGDYYFGQDQLAKAEPYYETAAAEPDWHLHSFSAELGAKLALCLNKSKGMQTALTYLHDLPEFIRKTDPIKYAISVVVKKQPDKLPPIWLPRKNQ